MWNASAQFSVLILSILKDKVRDLVSGRLVNAFCRADFVLGYIHRAAGKTLNVAGIVPVESSVSFGR